MIKINLVAETPAAASIQAERPQFSLGAKQGDIILLIVLALALVVVGTQWFLLTSKRSDLREIENQRRRERDELLVYIKKVEELEARREALRHKINVINELKRNQQGPVRILDEVSRALPELVWLGKLTLKGNGVELAPRRSSTSRFSRTFLEGEVTRSASLWPSHSTTLRRKSRRPRARRLRAPVNEDGGLTPWR
jgi:Tfp pilus assembly protein PilN